MNREEKQYLIKQANTVSEIGEISDGFHTFNSLYNQRLYLWAALVKAYKDKAWKSKKHDDGEPCFGGGWFLVGITTPAGDYTYHCEMKDWDLFDCKVLDKAPKFDGHTDKDVSRVLTLQPNNSQWIPVEKELPEVGEPVWFFTPIMDEPLKGAYQGNDTWWSVEYESKFIDCVTHWMPMSVPQRKEED